MKEGGIKSEMEILKSEIDTILNVT